ncbi:MAG TPA: amino acid adenylation domain-containing protein, partial [Longimicrobiaceae bacterium]
RLPRATGDGPEADGYATRTLVLPAAETARLREAARRCQVTLNALLQGAWGLLLSRYGAGEDVAFGSVVSVRPDDLPGADAVLGVCIAELPVRVRVEPREPAAAWLRTIHGAQLRARAAGPPPPGRRPYDTLLVFQNLPDTDFGGERVAGQEVLDFRRVPAAGGMGRALVLEATPRAELALALTHDLRRCDADGAARVLEHLRTLLEGIADDPERAVGELSPLSAAERARLAEWNRTEAEYPRRLCAHDLVAAQAARTPDAVAVEADDGTLTYAALERRSAGLAARLRGLGVGPETRVAVAVERSTGMAVAELGVLRAGGAYVPVDPAHPAERIAHVLADAGAAVMVADAATADSLPAHGARVVRLEEADDAEPADFDPGVGPESAAYVIYTSGSTGRPKGVVVPHRALVNFLHSMRARPGLSPADVLLAVTTLSFDIAALELLLPLVVGARVVVASRDAASDAGLLAARLASSGATVMQATPSTWRMLLDDGWTGRPGLRALCGGEALDAELARRLRPAVAALWNLYGPTETTVWSTVHEVVEAEGAPPVGRPVANTRLHLLDAALGSVPVGVEGELLVGGDGVARGYLGRPELTAERFLPDPSGGEPGARLYRTGDRARFRADGGLEYLGRADQQVKVRGFRVEPGEVEAVLGTHPAVRGCAVVAREDAGVLRDHLRRFLPDYMVPGAFVGLDALPLMPGGKVDLRALPAPDPG